ncbi:MAG: cyclic nucleotide-binding domain-containing protein [Microthrixaceae bacterium]|nr:cyclic nucleotide-binding domain-containing protein [Microthrixaceae bacterium]
MNAIPDRLQRIRNLPIFAACNKHELEEIDRLTDEISIPAGRMLMQQGELGQEFALIISGEAEVIRDDAVIATLGPGDYFGEVALLDSVSRTASVRAKTDMQLEVLDRRGFNTLLDDLPQLSRSILKGLAHRMAEHQLEIQRLRARLAEQA